LNYSITRILTATLSGNYDEFKQSFLGTKTTVNKEGVMLTITAAWN
jgi:VanZ family protein